MKTFVILGLVSLVSASPTLGSGRLSGGKAIQEDCDETSSSTKSLHSSYTTLTAYGDSNPSLIPSVTTTTTTLDPSKTTSSAVPAYDSQSSPSSLLVTTTTTATSFSGTSSSPLPAFDSQRLPSITTTTAYTFEIPHSRTLSRANNTTLQSDALPSITPTSFFSTITIKTTMLTTICPTTSIHESKGHSYTSTHVGTTTVFSTYHVTMPCDDCGSRNASSGVPDRVTPPYPAGNTSTPYLPTFLPSSSVLPSAPSDSTPGSGGRRAKPLDALMAGLVGIAMLLW